MAECEPGYGRVLVLQQYVMDSTERCFLLIYFFSWRGKKRWKRSEAWRGERHHSLQQYHIFEIDCFALGCGLGRCDGDLCLISEWKHSSSQEERHSHCPIPLSDSSLISDAHTQIAKPLLSFLSVKIRLCHKYLFLLWSLWRKMIQSRLFLCGFSYIK